MAGNLTTYPSSAYATKPMEVAEMPATLAGDFAALLRRLRQPETETSYA